MIDAYFGKNDFSFHNHASAATMAKIGRLFFPGAPLANLQTIQIKIAIANVIGVGTVLYGVPNFIPKQKRFYRTGPIAGYSSCT